MKSHLGRRPFTHMELHTLFSGYIYQDEKLPREQPKHWHFWIPVLAYYTGAYSDELGRLTLDDIVKVNGVRGFQLHTNSKIKQRFIPLHPYLSEHGFFAYLDYVKQQKHNRILFDLPSKSGRYSEKVRIWFSGEGKRLGYLQKCQIPSCDNDGRKASMSSFRLNFEEQIRIHAIQAGNKDAFNYLLGFKDYPFDEFDSTVTLSRITRGLRALPTKVSWQRFIDRHKA